MKRLLAFCFILALLPQMKAQEIKTGKIRKLPGKEDVISYGYESEGHRLVLRDREGKALYRYRELGNGLTAVEQTNPTERSAAASSRITARAAGKQIEINVPGREAYFISPAGDKLYIWISLSPDLDKILFKAVGAGAFICDLEGNILQELGPIDAPAWINSSWILGQKSEDDGHRFTQSDIVAVHPGTAYRQVLTTQTEEIAINAEVSPDGRRLAFENEKGEIFTMKIRIKQ